MSDFWASDLSELPRPLRRDPSSRVCKKRATKKGKLIKNTCCCRAILYRTGEQISLKSHVLITHSGNIKTVFQFNYCTSLVWPREGQQNKTSWWRFVRQLAEKLLPSTSPATNQWQTLFTAKGIVPVRHRAVMSGHCLSTICQPFTLVLNHSGLDWARQLWWGVLVGGK